jgi:hypothetical protein
MTAEGEWGRLLREGVVIVASILLAFAVDAWWDSSREANESFDQLVSLDAELAEALALLDSVGGNNRAMLVGINTLLELDEGAVRALPEARARTLVSDVMGVTTYNPTTAILSAMTTTGVAARLENTELRRGIGVLPGLLEDAAEEAVEIYAHGAKMNDRFAALGINTTWYAWATGRDGPLSAQEVLRRMISDDQLLQDMARWGITVTWYATELESVRTAMERTRRIISASFGTS